LEEIGEELEKRTRQISMDEEELEELKTKIESESAAKKKRMAVSEESRRKNQSRT
jgi:hypothetical protein